MKNLKNFVISILILILSFLQPNVNSAPSATDESVLLRARTNRILGSQGLQNSTGVLTFSNDKAKLSGDGERPLRRSKRWSYRNCDPPSRARIGNNIVSQSLRTEIHILNVPFLTIQAYINLQDTGFFTAGIDGFEKKASASDLRIPQYVSRGGMEMWVGITVSAVSFRGYWRIVISSSRASVYQDSWERVSKNHFRSMNIKISPSTLYYTGHKEPECTTTTSTTTTTTTTTSVTSTTTTTTLPTTTIPPVAIFSVSPYLPPVATSDVTSAQNETSPPSTGYNSAFENSTESKENSSVLNYNPSVSFWFPTKSSDFDSTIRPYSNSTSFEATDTTEETEETSETAETSETTFPNYHYSNISSYNTVPFTILDGESSTKYNPLPNSTEEYEYTSSQSESSGMGIHFVLETPQPETGSDGWGINDVSHKPSSEVYQLTTISTNVPSDSFNVSTTISMTGISGTTMPNTTSLPEDSDVSHTVSVVTATSVDGVIKKELNSTRLSTTTEYADREQASMLWCLLLLLPLLVGAGIIYGVIRVRRSKADVFQPKKVEGNDKHSMCELKTVSQRTTLVEKQDSSSGAASAGPTSHVIQTKSTSDPTEEEKVSSASPAGVTAASRPRVQSALISLEEMAKLTANNSRESDGVDETATCIRSTTQQDTDNKDASKPSINEVEDSSSVSSEAEDTFNNDISPLNLWGNNDNRANTNYVTPVGNKTPGNARPCPQKPVRKSLPVSPTSDRQPCATRCNSVPGDQDCDSLDGVLKVQFSFK